jgi:hypothetical protein
LVEQPGRFGHADDGHGKVAALHGHRGVQGRFARVRFEKTLETLDNESLETIDDVLACDKQARRIAETL